MEKMKQALMSYVETHGAGVSNHDLAQLFRELSEHYSHLKDVEPHPVTTSESSPDFSLWARTPEETFRLLRDTLNIGAVIFDQVTNVEKLHAEVVVELHFPEEHVHIVTTGRVIHVYETGTAIELSNLSSSDRATLEPIYEKLKKVSADPVKTPAKPPAAMTMETGNAKQIELKVPLRRMGANKTYPGQIPSKNYLRPAREPERDNRVRRVFDVPEPDVSMIKTSEAMAKRVGSRTEEFFGPATPWVTPKAEPDRREELSEDRIRDIVMQLAHESFTGILECSHLEHRYQLKFENGLFVQVTTFPRIPDFEFGPMIRDAGHIDSSQLEMASAFSDENEVSIERALMELQILDAPRIRSAIAGRLTFFLERILNWREGFVRFYDGTKCPPDFLPQAPLRVHVIVERLLFKQFYEETKALDRQKRDRLVFPHMESYPEVVSEEWDRIERTLTEPEHFALVHRVRTTRRRLQEVFTESAISNIETLCVLWALHRMDMIRFDTSLHQTIVRERYREKVTVKFLSVHKASYFEVLNVHWSSYDQVVEVAYRELCEQFDPESAPANLEAEVLDRVIEIRQQIEDAYDVLSTRKTRHAYRKRVMPEYKLAHSIPLFLKQVELAEQREDWVEARDNTLRVLEIDPENARGIRLLQHIERQIDRRSQPQEGEKKL